MTAAPASSASARTTRILRYTARIIALLWAGWWTFSGLASGIGQGLDISGILIHTTTPGLLFLVIAIIPWRWERIGAIYLVVTGLLVFIAFPFTYGRYAPSSAFSVLSTVAVPPFIAGGMLVACWRKSRPTDSPGS